MKNKHLTLKIVFILAAVLAVSATGIAGANAANNVGVMPEPAATPARQTAAAQTPRTVVADLYKVHDGKRSPFFQTKSRALVDKYFAKSLADLIWKDANASKGEVGAIEGDPLYNAQDTRIRKFVIGAAEIKGKTATVPVTFTNFDEKKKITFSLSFTTNWKIDDILYNDGDSLMKWLKDTYPDKTGSTGTGPGLGYPEFYGRYQVGDTTCTVKAADMSFDVRWAKGTVETYLFIDGTTFESTALDTSNRFVFDNSSSTTGTFFGAGGKRLPVKRLE